MEQSTDFIKDLNRFRIEITDDFEYFSAASQHILSSVFADKNLKKQATTFLIDSLDTDKGIINALISQLADTAPDMIKNFQEIQSIILLPLQEYSTLKIDPSIIMELFEHSDYKIRILALELIAREIVIVSADVLNDTNDVDIKAHEIRMLKEWVHIVSDYYYDEISFVRSRALSITSELVKQKLIPATSIIALLNRVQSRILDQTSTTRNKALEAATEIMINMTPSVNLDSEYLQNQLASCEDIPENQKKKAAIQNALDISNVFRAIVRNIGSIISIAKDSELTSICSYLVASSMFKLDGLTDVLQQLVCHLASEEKVSNRKLISDTLVIIIFGKGDIESQAQKYFEFIRDLPGYYDKIFLEFLVGAEIPRGKEVCMYLMNSLNEGAIELLRPLSLLYQSMDFKTQSITAVLIKHIYNLTRDGDQLIVTDKPFFLLELLSSLSSTIDSIVDPGPVISVIQPLLAYRLNPQLWVAMATEIFMILERLLTLDEIGFIVKSLIEAHNDWQYSVHVHMFCITRIANLIFLTSTRMINEKEKLLKSIQATQDFVDDNMERQALENGLSNAAEYQINMVSPYLDMLRTVAMAAIDCLEENLEDQFITILALQCSTAVALLDKKIHIALLPYLSQIIADDPSEHLKIVAIASFGDLMMANVDIAWNSMYRNSIYFGCRDENVEVARTALAVISKLLMQAIIKPDHGLGHIMALTVSTDDKSQALALQLCHQLGNQSPSPLYNYFGDIIGELRIQRSISNDDFKAVMKLILNQIKTAKENEGLLMKLFERIDNAASLEDARSYAECLSFLKLHPGFVEKLPKIVKETISRKWLHDPIIVKSIIETVDHHNNDTAVKEIQRIVSEITTLTI